MDVEEGWQVIERERRSLADLLETLTDDEWERPSLCVGWRVRDVAAHLTLAPQPPGPGSMLWQGIRARGSFHRLNHDAAVRHAQRPGADLVAELRAHARSRRLPLVTNYRNILFDVLVHGQDIAIPLGHPREIPTDAAIASATRVWTMGWPFWAKHRLRGVPVHRHRYRLDRRDRYRHPRAHRRRVARAHRTTRGRPAAVRAGTLGAGDTAPASVAQALGWQPCDHSALVHARSSADSGVSQPFQPCIAVQINLFGAAPMVTGAMCRDAPNGGRVRSLADGHHEA